MSARTRLPVVTLILIAANMIAAFALVWQPDLAFDLGFRPDHPTFRGAITSLFLHQNLLHLLGNMVFLAAVGAAVELATGSLRFSVVYFLSGLCGVLAHWVFTRKALDPTPLIGASGAIAGCAGYYAIRYLRLKVPLAPKFGVSILAITMLWVALQVVGAFVRLGDPEGGVAFWSHLGGFVSGLLLSFCFRAPDYAHLKLGHQVLEEMNARSPAAAAATAKQHLEVHPNDPKGLQELAEALDKLGNHDEEAATLVRLFGVEPSPEILRRLGDLARLQLLPTMERLKLAERYRSVPDVSKSLLLSVIEGDDEVQRPDAMLALAGLERETDEANAATILAKLLDTYPLHPTVELARTRGWIP